MSHDPRCPVMDRAAWPAPGGVYCMCYMVRRVRAETMEMEAARAIKARDRCRLNSDAWSRLDRFACDLFEDARAVRGNR